MNGQQRIDVMYAYICLDEDGTEGVPALEMGGNSYPLMGADMAMAAMLRPYAMKISKQMGKKVTLCRFSTREIVEEFLP